MGLLGFGLTWRGTGPSLEIVQTPENQPNEILEGISMG